MLDGFDAPAARSAEIARVIVDIDLAHMDRPLDYVVPDTLVDQAQVGSLVRVRFSGSRVDGWIVERTRREVDDHVGRVESVVSAPHSTRHRAVLRRVSWPPLPRFSHSRCLPGTRARKERNWRRSPPRGPRSSTSRWGRGGMPTPLGRRSCPVCVSGNLRAPSLRRCALICARACRTPWPRPWPRDAPSSS